MTTIINTPGNVDDSGASLVMGVILAIIIIAFFIIYGLPAIRNSQSPQKNDTVNVNLKLPAPPTDGPTALAPNGSPSY